MALAKEQGWHIGIGRYDISADMANIGKTDISVWVMAPVPIYRPILSADISVLMNQYRLSVYR